jgi:hypothetical protein
MGQLIKYSFDVDFIPKNNMVLLCEYIDDTSFIYLLRLNELFKKYHINMLKQLFITSIHFVDEDVFKTLRANIPEVLDQGRFVREVEHLVDSFVNFYKDEDEKDMRKMISQLKNIIFYANCKSNQ